MAAPQGSLFRAERRKRIDVRAAQPDVEVNVRRRPGKAHHGVQPAVARERDELAALHALPGAHQRPTQMVVGRDEPATMIEDHLPTAAMELARLTGAVLVLGSATPALETLRAALTGQTENGQRAKRLMLTRRAAGRPLPPVEVIHMGDECRDQKRYAYLSRRLIEELGHCIKRREQAILFMNRRGYATIITCLRCWLRTWPMPARTIRHGSESSRGRRC